MKLCIDLQLFANVDYFKLLERSSHVYFDTYEYFKKSTFRNRYQIPTANGVIALTAPIAGGREQKVRMLEALIDTSVDWKTRHWRGIVSTYKKAPYFDFYCEQIRNLLFNPEKRLIDYSFNIITNLCNLFQINAHLAFTSSNESIVSTHDARDVILPAKVPMGNESWQPRYAQVFEDRIGFQPNMSILDLLFCEGPRSRLLLRDTTK